VSTAATPAPDATAIRVALWRALHLEVDDAPHVFTDDVALRLARPESDWRSRGDMSPDATAAFRASIVARARFVDDLVCARAGTGVDQYVILGAGLDTFAQRHAELAETLRIYEVDQPATQAWKRDRLHAEGLSSPAGPRFVAIDFEGGESWWDGLLANGFDPSRTTVVSSTGVSMYLTRAATEATVAQLAALGPGSSMAMTFMLPLDLVAASERELQARVEAAARASGTPFLSHYAPADMVDMCRAAGFSEVRHVGPDELIARYFAGRGDGLRPPTAEHFVVATV
jgi:methyltransferase (TIGR00027 family)